MARWCSSSADTIPFDATLSACTSGPIVVIGTTNDPATPLESSQKMTRSLEGGVLVKVTGNGHTGYTRSACAQKIVNRYLIDGEPPSAEVECG